MLPNPPVSLRFRLIVSIAGVLGVVLLLGSVLIYWHALGEVHTELEASILVGRNTVHNAVDDVEESETPLLRHLELLVADFDGDRHLRVSLVNANDQVLYRSSPLPPDQPAPEWFYHLLARSIAARVALPSPFDRVGSILLETDARNEISEVWQDVVLTFGVLVAFCVLNAVLVYWVTGRALRPLNAVSAAFSALGAGDYRLHLAEEGSRELALLCRGFNRMAGQLAAIEDRKQRLEHQLAAVQEEERSELARDLHDEIGPLLFAVSIDLSVLQQESAVRGTPLAARLESIRDSIGHLYRDVKAILARLRPATLVDLGLNQATEKLVSFWKLRYPSVDFRLHVAGDGFGAELDETIYHIILEGLSNALRHGRPSTIDIRVDRDANQIQVQVADDGIGLPALRNTTGLGLIGMRERVNAQGGELSIENSTMGSGVRISARLPLQASPMSMAVTS